MGNGIIPKDQLQEWQKFLAHNAEIPSKAEDLEQIAQEITIDLHLYNLDEAYQKIEMALTYALQQNIKIVKIITGKSGKLYQEVPNWLATKKFTHMIKSCKQEKHNSGCLCITLK